MLLVLILLALRVLRVGSYWLYAQAPGPLGCLTVIVALPLFGVLSILMLPFHVLLYWHLVLSGFKDGDADLYVNWIIGPVIGTRD